MMLGDGLTKHFKWFARGFQHLHVTRSGKDNPNMLEEGTGNSVFFEKCSDQAEKQE